MEKSIRELVKKPPRAKKPKVDSVIAKAPTGKRRGRPPGQYAQQLALKELMYNHPDREKLVHEVFRAALDEEHKNQGIAWKLLMDRMAPVSGFEKLRGTNAIAINITTVGAPEVTGEVIEGEDFEEA